MQEPGESARDVHGGRVAKFGRGPRDLLRRASGALRKKLLAGDSVTAPSTGYSLIGFSAEDRAEHDLRAARLRFHATAPDTSSHAHATIVKADQVDVKEFFGGVYDADGNLIPLSRVARGPRQRCFVGAAAGHEPVPSREVDAAAVYGGLAFQHFGHFLLETFSRVWSASLVASGAPIYVQCPGRAMPPFASRLYELAGMGGSICPVTESIRFREVMVPGPSFVIRCSASRAFKELGLRVADAVLGGQIATTSEQPLYLSRSQMPSSARTLVGERILEDVLRDNRFKVVHPQTLDLAEQIRLINTHRHLVGPIGSAFHLMMFSRIVNHAYCMTSKLPNPNYILNDILNEAKTTYVRSTSAPAPFWDASFASARIPELLDVPATLEALTDLGMIRNADVRDEVVELRKEYHQRFLRKALTHAIDRRDRAITEQCAALVREEFPTDEDLNGLLAEARPLCSDD